MTMAFRPGHCHVVVSAFEAHPGRCVKGGLWRDFSSASFTYVAEGDTELRTFGIQPAMAPTRASGMGVTLG